MSGRDVTPPTATENGAANVRMASHFRRLQTAVASSTPAPFRGVASGIDQRSLTVGIRLRHQHDVAVPEVDVLVLSTGGDDLVVVERNALHRLSVRTEDHDAVAGRELIEAAGEGQNVEHRGPALELVAGGLRHFADHRNL